ncbi:MAG TPA: L-histidine N(alpha)-methyltransferase, partial [Egibacteraceae bacterium]|nr:L-histidine N(alpha)-methyltransferase [Egibacteraceae bacterium]
PEHLRGALDGMSDSQLLFLTAVPKTLPPKWFYDARGSALFERITRLPEYYQTRTETAILEAVVDEVAAAVGPAEIVELGSGSSRKTRLLLEAMHARCGGERYVAFDVSEEALRAAGRALRADYPWLEVHGVVGDFDRHLADIPGRDARRLVAFLGSTIGNLHPDRQRPFLHQVAGLLTHPDDGLLLGVDLVKDPATLRAAYDDAAGVTAAFNRNVLHVINRELDADLPVDAFAHVARWRAECSWIEMALRADREVAATIGAIDLPVRFAAGEEVRTEISCKFTRDGVQAVLADAGLALARWDTDRDGRFALALARRARGRRAR